MDKLKIQEKSLARAQLPKAVNAVGDRIGLNYRIDRKAETRKYAAESQAATRLGFDQLKNTYYSLTESKTKKASGKGADNKAPRRPKIVNPLKLSSRTRKTLYTLSAEERQKLEYCTFEKVHELWLQYFNKVVNDGDLMGIFRMDLHGCKLKCTASRNPSLVCAEGIVVQESRNTFLIITVTNRLLTLPKRESIFEFEVRGKLYRIHGCNLLFTTQTRSKVKYKQMKCCSDI